MFLSLSLSPSLSKRPPNNNAQNPPQRPAEDPALVVFQNRLSTLISDAEKFGKEAALSPSAAAAKRALAGAVEIAKKARSCFARAAAELQKAAKAKPTKIIKAPAVGGKGSKAPAARRGAAAAKRAAVPPPLRASTKLQKTTTAAAAPAKGKAKKTEKSQGPVEVADASGSGGLFEVEAILDDRVVLRKGRDVHEILVKWRGFPGEDSWEPVRNFANNEVWHAYANAKKNKKK